MLASDSLFDVDFIEYS